MKKRRIAVICLAASVVVAIGVRLALPAMLVAVANKQFSKCLTLPVKLNAVHLGVLAGRVTFEDLAVRQPDGFGGDLLLKTPEVEVKVAGWSLLGSALTVDEVIVTDLTVHLVRDKEGKVNLAGLLRPQKWNSKPIHFKKITVRNSTVQYTDFAAGNKAYILRTVDGKQHQLGVRLDDLLKGGDVTANVDMRPGDVLVVPESLF